MVWNLARPRRAAKECEVYPLQKHSRSTNTDLWWFYDMIIYIHIYYRRTLYITYIIWFDMHTHIETKVFEATRPPLQTLVKIYLKPWFPQKHGAEDRAAQWAGPGPIREVRRPVAPNVFGRWFVCQGTLELRSGNLTTMANHHFHR